ncbi:hypothetical protein F7725_001411 [Dissostichus mawsoni]|uniref:PDZ domain-containing protein n=1 Tax=Dissostichus mawsoni TaxID=36200 RepID=A0A7J5ZHQ7_DISMA|nr:hypothetical protein F7725_001411 [Dissostichus mawsoni]
MILDAQWCRGLMKGDVIKEINRQNVQTLSHAQVVDILKELPAGSEVALLCSAPSQPPLKPMMHTTLTSVLHTTLTSVLHTTLTSVLHTTLTSVLHTTLTSVLHTTLTSVLGGYTPVISLFSFSSSSSSSSSPSSLQCTVSQPPLRDRKVQRSSHPPMFPQNPNSSPVSSSPKPDASELYLRSRALLESKLQPCIQTQEVYIGAIVPLGAAEKDGRLRAGDELLCIDGVAVKGKTHKQVLDLMTNAARNGQVMLTVRRKLTHTDGDEVEGPLPLSISSPQTPRIQTPPPPCRAESFDVFLQRRENEGFGFVILTSKNKPPPGVIPHKIGRIIEGSPTDRSGQMKVGDRISAVNGRSIMDLSHNDIVQLIKEAGTQVGDQIVEINGEATQGITHTRAIELIQAGGSKVLLLLRAGGGAVPDHSSKDKVAAPLRLSEGPSSSSLSTSEISPSSPKTSEENRSRSHSPRKTEREHSGSLEDMRKDVRKDMRKAQEDLQEPGGAAEGENPGIGKSDGDGTLGRRRTKEKEEVKKEKEEVKKEKEEVKKDPRGSSSSSINDPGCNGVNKKTPTISPGPWKVPSSSKIHNQESSYADI